MNLLKLLSYVVPTFATSYLLWYLSYPYVVNHFCVVCFLFILSWTIGYYFYEQLNQELVPTSGKAVLITGCDSGFGYQLAQRLDRLGFHVYAGVLFPEGDGARKLQEICSKRLHVHRMDVTSAEEVSAVVEKIKASGLPLWAVVNNAGIGLSSPWDWGKDVEVFEKTFNVNVLGVVRVSKHCIPLLRKSRGRIVNVASLAARMTVPWISHYCMAKHAVRVFSDSLRRELIGSGIKVVTLEPTFYKTPIIDFEQVNRARAKIYEDTPADVKAAYDETFHKYLDDTKTMVNTIARSNVEEVVDAMVDGVVRKHPKLFYRCCSYLDVLLIWATSHLPELLLDSVMKLVFNRKYSKLLKML